MFSQRDQSNSGIEFQGDVRWGIKRKAATWAHVTNGNGAITGYRNVKSGHVFSVSQFARHLHGVG